MVDNNVTPRHMAAHDAPWYTRDMINKLKKRVKEEHGGDENVVAMLDYIGKLEYKIAKERQRVRELNARLEDIAAIGN